MRQIEVIVTHRKMQRFKTLDRSDCNTDISQVRYKDISLQRNKIHSEWLQCNIHSEIVRHSACPDTT